MIEVKNKKKTAVAHYTHSDISALISASVVVVVVVPFTFLSLRQSIDLTALTLLDAHHAARETHTQHPDHRRSEQLPT